MTDVLIIENRIDTAELIRDYLEMHDISAEIEENADAGLSKALSGDYSLLIYDREIAGIEMGAFLSKVRDRLDLPVLLLIPEDADAEQIRALDAGADDVMVKPVKGGVVTARVRALLRFYNRVRGVDAADAAVLECNGIRIDGTKRRVRVRGKEKKLTRKEFDLLYFLMRHPDEVYTKEDLYRNIWGMDAAGGIATIIVHIKKLREKIEEKPSHPVLLMTEWGTGYYFSGENDSK